MIRAAQRLGTEDIRAALSTHYGLAATGWRRLGGEIDDNLRVTTTGGRDFLLKVSQRDIADPLLSWQTAVLEHLAGTAGIPTPRPVPALDGRSVVGVDVDGRPYALRLMTWIPGIQLADLDEHPPGLLDQLGRVAGGIANALATLPAPDVPPSHDWDMTDARRVIDEGLDAIRDPRDSSHIVELMGWYDAVAPSFAELPRQVVHQDLNDANVLVSRDGDGTARISGVIDMNDSLHTVRVAEVAVCVAYAMTRKDDPLSAAAAVVAGFHAVCPLTPAELKAVFPLAVARLCMNATTWNRRVLETGSRYGRERMRHSWPAIRRLSRLTPEVAEVTIRAACGQSVTAAGIPAPSGRVLPDAEPVALDLSVGSDLFDGVDFASADAVRAAVDAHLPPGVVGVSEHLRAVLPWADRRRPGIDEPETLPLGVLLHTHRPVAIHAPYDGFVVRAADPLVLDHGGFFTCWWGLNTSDTAVCHSELKAGRFLGMLRPDEPAQLQLVTSESLALRPPPRRVRSSESAAWRALAPDPAGLLLGLATVVRKQIGDILETRGKRFARSQRAYYKQPMNLVRGRGVWLYDEDGRAYLDSLNNVTHIGHCDPRISRAAYRQMRKLNTNSRFIYEGIASYAEKLIATLPPPLEVCFLVCTGSEANDLALRIARQVTGRQDIVVLDGAYHGNTGVVTGISPNRYKGPGGTGAPPTTHEVPIPDRYRGPWGYDEPDPGARYGAEAERVIRESPPPAAFIAESLMGSAGNIILPDGFLPRAFAAARAAGALCISDEVQVGVGRLGDAFWGFQLAGVVPDIVTMGKPLGNGHPLAAVVTTREIADAFDTGMKYFNTFGGNPVSCAVGETVLDIVRQDGLQEHAKEVGAHFLRQLRAVADRQEVIGDVRGQGLYLGVELVTDRATKEPARDLAFEVTERMKDHGVIVFPNGVHDNVLKIKPPMVFGRHHADLYAEALDQVLTAIPRRLA